MATPRTSFTTASKSKQRNAGPIAVADLPYHRRTPWYIVLPDGNDDGSSRSSSSDVASRTSNTGQSESVNATSEGFANTSSTFPLSEGSESQSGSEAEFQTKSYGHKDNDTSQANESVQSATRAELLAEMDRVREQRLGKEPFPYVFLIWRRS